MTFSRNYRRLDTYFFISMVSRVQYLQNNTFLQCVSLAAQIEAHFERFSIIQHCCRLFAACSAQCHHRVTLASARVSLGVLRGQRAAGVTSFLLSFFWDVSGHFGKFFIIWASLRIEDRFQALFPILIPEFVCSEQQAVPLSYYLSWQVLHLLSGSYKSSTFRGGSAMLLLLGSRCLIGANSNLLRLMR